METLYSNFSFVSSTPSILMSSICSQGMVLATAMAAVSGTVILLALRLQKAQFPLVDPIIPGGLSSSRQQSLRPCISSEGKKKSKKKRVHFAEDVVDPRGDGEEFRRQHDFVAIVKNSRKVKKTVSGERKPSSGGGGKMPANRLALYNGILRDRVVHRLGCSY